MVGFLQHWECRPKLSKASSSEDSPRSKAANGKVRFGTRAIEPSLLTFGTDVSKLFPSGPRPDGSRAFFLSLPSCSTYLLIHTSPSVLPNEVGRKFPAYSWHVLSGL